jgi:CheY-like chemotaxis protein
MPSILVVDDARVSRRFLVSLLTESGYRVLEAVDGAEGLAATRAERPDLVIADILMPKMDGYEMVRRIRSDPSIAGTRVMFLSANYLEREAEALARACGVPVTLTKSTEPAVVLDHVREALARPPTLTVPPEAFHDEHVGLLTDKLSQKVGELEGANERLTALVDLGRQLTSERDPRRLVETTCAAARDVIGARFAVLGILADDGRRLRQVATSGLDPEAVAAIEAAPADGGILRRLLRDRRPWRVHYAAASSAAPALPPGHPPVRSLLGTAIHSAARVYGWLYLGDPPDDDEFRAEDEPFLTSVAAQLAVAYENAELFADLESRVAERTAQLEKAVVDLEAQIRARKLLEAALRKAEREAARLQTVSEMGGTVAHELNQPLAIVTGYLELLRVRPHRPEEAAPVLAKIEAAAAELAEKIKEIEGLRGNYVTKSYGPGLTVVDLQRSAERVADEEA